MPVDLDARVIRMLTDIREQTMTLPAFRRGLEHWQWKPFVDWHIGTRERDQILGNPILLRTVMPPMVVSRRENGKDLYEAQPPGRLDDRHFRVVCQELVRPAFPGALISLLASMETRRAFRLAFEEALRTRDQPK